MKAALERVFAFPGQFVADDPVMWLDEGDRPERAAPFVRRRSAAVARPLRRGRYAIARRRSTGSRR